MSVARKMKRPILPSSVASKHEENVYFIQTLLLLEGPTPAHIFYNGAPYKLYDFRNKLLSYDMRHVKCLIKINVCDPGESILL